MAGIKRSVQSINEALAKDVDTKIFDDVDIPSMVKVKGRTLARVMKRRACQQRGKGYM